MAKVALETVGCRLNQYETERLAADLVRLGMERVSYTDVADLYVLNSCTVTARADADCRKLISRAYRTNKGAVIVVAGCYVDAESSPAAGLPGVTLAVGNADKMHLARIVQERFPQLFDQVIPAGTGIERTFIDNLFSPNRPMVKIGDGCNEHCSYCIVPSVRGQLVSYSADAIVDEVKRLTAAGYHEAVLTAVHIGRYENDGLNLAGLVDRILQETPLARLRFSSLEPNELDARLLELVTTHPRVCRHLHLPLQSGSNRILQLMRRPYTREDYLAVVERIKQANADVTIGCDLIVGFPGETDAEFRQSLALLDSGFVDYSHVFSYSDRPGTAATALPGKVRIEEIKERNRRAREISERNRARQMTSQTGKVLGVISEKTPGHDGIHRGVSDNYLKVHLACGTGGGKEIIRFRVTSLVAHHLEGDIITND